MIDVDGTRLVTDPVLGRRVWHLRRDAAVDLRPARWDSRSHAHFDHLDRASLRRLDRSLPVVAPSGVGGSCGDGGSQVLEVVAGDELELGGLSLRVTHMSSTSRAAGRFSPRSASVGYIAEGSRASSSPGTPTSSTAWPGLAPSTSPPCPSPAGARGCRPATWTHARRRGAAAPAAEDRGARPLGNVQDAVGPPPDDRPAREFVRAAAEVAPRSTSGCCAIGETLARDRAA